MRSAVFAAIVSLLVAGPVLAGEGAPTVPPPGGATVLMSPVALPVVVDGKLINYVFVTLRLRLAPNADSLKLRAMEPYFRDALVRVGTRTPFVRPDNYTILDDAKLKAAVLGQAAALAGAGQVTGVQIVREQSQHFSGLPKPSQPAR